MVSKRFLSVWVLSILFLIGSIVAVGGITRLTDSGLSMVEWRPIYGILPPMTDHQWSEVFDSYKHFPQYQQTHSHLQLNDFKKIFFWEYLHRILGRVIGLVIVCPYIVLLLRRKLFENANRYGLAMSVGVVLQGIVGWYMVKSGLVSIARVSHFRLASHLSLAFILFCIALLFFLHLHWSREKIIESVLFRVFGIGVCIQIVYGAFTAGMDAGFMFNTFPKMGDVWIAPDVVAFTSWIQTFFFNPASIQFIHRILGTLLFVLALILSIKDRRFFILFLVTCIQFIMGVSTLVLHVPIVLGVLHQLGALLLLSTTVILWYLYLA